MIKLFSILLIIVFSSCSGTDCGKLPTTFNSFDEAERQIENAHFNLKDDVNTSKSLWIRGAK